MEHRRYKRVEISGNISGKMIFVTDLNLLDLSLSGVRFNCFRRVNTNSIYKIKIEKDDLSLTLQGTIVRSIFKGADESNGAYSPTYEVAMDFNKLSDKDTHALEVLINQIGND